MIDYTDPNYYRWHLDHPDGDEAKKAIHEMVETYREADSRLDSRSLLEADQQMRQANSANPNHTVLCSLGHVNLVGEDFCFDCGEVLS